ncbi:hypothetical protein EP7_003775 [Isosphaeraceae bacterium EP7]
MRRSFKPTVSGLESRIALSGSHGHRPAVPFTYPLNIESTSLGTVTVTAGTTRLATRGQVDNLGVSTIVTTYRPGTGASAGTTTGTIVLTAPRGTLRLDIVGKTPGPKVQATVPHVFKYTIVSGTGIGARLRGVGSATVVFADVNSLGLRPFTPHR